MSDLFWFSDTQWARIKPLLPSNTRGLKRVDDHRVLSGIVHVIRSGGRPPLRTIGVRCAGRVRTLQDLVQSLCQVGPRHMGGHFLYIDWQ